MVPRNNYCCEGGMGSDAEPRSSQDRAGRELVARWSLTGKHDTVFALLFSVPENEEQIQRILEKEKRKL